MSEGKLCVGVDVGGTNTDAAILFGADVVAWQKVETTSDVTSGVVNAIEKAFASLPANYRAEHVHHVSIGTTHFMNATVQRSTKLSSVALIRLCGPATRSLPPFSDFPEEFSELLNVNSYMVSGGFHYDASVVTELHEAEVRSVARDIYEKGIRNVVVSGMFSSLKTDQEETVASWLRHEYADFSITCSHTIGNIGILERENASVLNESLKSLCEETIASFKSAFDSLGLCCPFYLTQNDGTLISAKDAMRLPVNTFASGATNSMRGAVFLSGLKDAIVVDIGGTTTDVGVIKNGFPREASTRVKVGGVNTNFRMPDVLSVALGGGSIVQELQSGKVTIGPKSVGYKLNTEALIFGGSTLTATDVAVAGELAVGIGDISNLRPLEKTMVQVAVSTIRHMLENAIDKVKIIKEDQPVVLVGGGGVIIDSTLKLKGASGVVKPKFFEVANAVGAALGHISGTVDTIVSGENRAEVINKAKSSAKEAAINAGADPLSVEIVDVRDEPIAYIPGGMSRITVKAVGGLLASGTVVPAAHVKTDNANLPRVDGVTITSSLTSNVESDEGTWSYSGSVLTVEESEEITNMCFQSGPVDPVTGEWTLNEYDIDCISIGAGIMGCGGGGSPYLGRLRALKTLREGKAMRVIHPSRLVSTPERQQVAVPVAYMGSPLCLIENMVSGTEILQGLDVHLSHLQAKEKNLEIGAVFCCEIGGINSLEPLTVGAELGLPVVDADGMGRAFPELQMYIPHIYGHPHTPTVLVDSCGNKILAVDVESPKKLEGFLRSCCILTGCVGGLCFAPLTKQDVFDKSVLYSMSHVWRLGDSINKARREKVSIREAVTKFLDCDVIIEGKIVDVSKQTTRGYTMGGLEIEGLDDFTGFNVVINFQNEFLIAKRAHDGHVIATVPDMMSVLDVDTGHPIVVEEIRYGQRVFVVVMPCDEKLRTETALGVVGPKAFGYDVEYKPVKMCPGFEPIPTAAD